MSERWNQESVARVIAYAPELLDTLKEVLDAWEYGSSVNDERELYDKAAALVAEVEGIK